MVFPNVLRTCSVRAPNVLRTCSMLSCVLLASRQTQRFGSEAWSGKQRNVPTDWELLPLQELLTAPLLGYICLQWV
jgi:hypothetical protein